MCQEGLSTDFPYFFPPKKNTSELQQLVTFGEYLVRVSIFKSAWYSRGSMLKQPTGELNIGARWGQVLHSHWIKCCYPCIKTKCAWRGVSYWLEFVLSYWFLPSCSCQNLQELTKKNLFPGESCIFWFNGNVVAGGTTFWYKKVVLRNPGFPSRSFWFENRVEMLLDITSYILQLLTWVLSPFYRGRALL